MEIIKKRILVSDLTSGEVHMKIQLNQKIDDMGISTDMPYDSYKMVTELNGDLTFGHFTDTDLVEHYSQNGEAITYITDSKLQALKSYDAEIPYKKDLDMNTETYYDYRDTQIVGVDKVTNVDGDEVTYVTGAEKYKYWYNWPNYWDSICR